MSPKAFIRSASALIVLLAAACSETLAPKLERIEAQIANALTCTINWTGAAPEADNDWRNANNWAPARLPDGSDNVCITTDGSFAQLFGTVNVNSITVGVPGSSNPAWLAVRGTGIGSTGPEVNALLTVANGIENNGRVTMDITHRGTARITLTGGVFENKGRFQTLKKNFGANGGDVTHWFNANVVNDGLIDFYSSVEMTGSWTNRGAVKLTQVPNNFEQPYFYILTNGSFNQVSGSLDVAGTFELRDGLFRLQSGAITGSEGPIVLGGTFEIADNVNNASGNVTLRRNVAMSGHIPAALTVIVAGHRESTTGFIFNTIVTAANGFNNDGRITLTGTGHQGGSGTLLVVNNNGTIVNQGRIEALVPERGERRISSSIRNLAGATIAADAGLVLDKPGATYVNEGTITVAPSTFVALNGAPSFAQLAGALTLGANAQWKQDGGSFQLAGGAITGRPWLAGIALDIPAGSPASGTLLLTHTNTLAGDVPAGVKLHVEQWRGGSTGFSFDGILNAGASFTNFGTIVLGNPGFNPNPAKMVMLNGSTLTNKGRFETVFDPAGGHRYIVGNFTNEGTLQLDNWTEFTGGTVRALAPAAVTMGATGNGLLDLMPGATLIASGTWPVQLVNRGNLHIGAPGTAAQLNLTGPGYSGANTSSVTVDIGGSPAAPGSDFDRMTMTGPMTVGNGTMHVRAVNGACIDGGKSYDVIAFSHPSGNFAGYTGLDLGGGRTVQPQQLSNGYRLSVIGPVCPPPDNTPPAIAPTVTGTLGLAGWYTSDVNVTWSVTDTESPITTTVGCDGVSLTTDNAGVTYTCSATSAGGTATQSVTIKRDATPPVVTTSQSPMPNANGWNNTDVTAFWSGSDAMSGLDGAANRQSVFNGEGIAMNFGGRYFDRAGNKTEVLIYASIDRTKPTVTASRAPAANANGWNNTDVTATYSATDGLSGIDGSASATRTFSVEGANQDGSYLFTDRAGNTATADVGGVSIDKTGPTVTFTRTPANAFGWNNTTVNVAWDVSDALSGVSGLGSFTQPFPNEGVNQGITWTFRDAAGNSTNASVSDINIDKTAPLVTVTRSPAPDATGWNNTDVTATWNATDALSGIAGSSTATHLFNTDGAGQSASRSFADKAGNSASATISGINIDKTPTPPPPPPTMTPACSATPSEIWAPNNKMVAVRVTVGGTGVTSYRLRSVSNNETGSSDVDGWTIGTADVDGSVKATRLGGGSGRTYTLTYDVFGAGGATGSCAVTVRVPHDQGKKS